MIPEIHSSRIQLLPENIIDQIKAGEVIERPATLLKELVENSLDAGAKRVKITIENNGIDLVSVEDDGHGISFEDLPLAFYRHATSKIQKFEDLYNLYSYGFRGEALASMASVSKITCSSSHEGESSVLKIEGGQIVSHQKSEYHSEINGTQIFVKDLFYNTPVRLKFVGSKNSEKNQLKKMVSSFILTRPGVEFSVKFDNQSIKTYPVSTKFTDRINRLLFPKNEQSFYHNKREFEEFELEVYLSEESSKGHAGKQQYIFVNDRFIQDQTIHKIICNSASHLWPFGQIGHYMAFIKTAPHMVDVNVHPNKINIKFHTPAKIHSLISQTVKEIKSKQEILPSRTPEELIIPAHLDPMDNSNNELHTFDYKGTRYDNLKNSSDFTPSNLGWVSLSNRFAITTIQNEKYLVDFFALAIQMIQEYNKTDTLIPLMVAEPIRNLTAQQMKQAQSLNNFGFDLEKLEEKTLLLKSYPEKLDLFNCANIIKIILSSNLADLNKLVNSTFEDLVLVNNIYGVSDILKRIPTGRASSFIKAVTPESLHNFFYLNQD